MKELAFVPLAFGFAAHAARQAPPDSPAPADTSGPAWSQLQNLVHGRAIIVDNTNGQAVHCLFAGVTEAYLFCDPPGNPAGVGFCFDHAEVLVDPDLPRPASAKEVG